MSYSKKEICELCEEYGTDTNCDNEAVCKIMSVMRENERLKAENKMLKNKVSELENKMSYMVNPMAIGDRNGQMGW